MASHQRLTRVCLRLSTRLATAVVLATAAGGMVVPPARADDPASVGLVHSDLGFVGCVDPGFTPGVITNDYCFVAERVADGAAAGSVSVRAWTYAHSLPATVISDERVLAPATALVVGSDGSFTLSVDLPRMGSVLIRGAGAGVHTAVAQDDGNTSFPLTYAVGSPSVSLTPYDTGAGPNAMQEGTVAGQRQVELQAAVWAGEACGGWQFAGVI